jgi:aryl-alcohol dehydrogenase-like predicted oxidoreductase
MRRARLGRRGLNVTQLGFGAGFRPGQNGVRRLSDEAAEKVLNAVLDAGINFIDTAPDYGFSGERIGRCISARRDEYFLATKCGCDPADSGGPEADVPARVRVPFGSKPAFRNCASR